MVVLQMITGKVLIDLGFEPNQDIISRFKLGNLICSNLGAIDERWGETLTWYYNHKEICSLICPKTKEELIAFIAYLKLKGCSIENKYPWVPK